jgi:hypothetical protein
MTCARCGTSVTEGANYCGECGLHVAGAAPEVPATGSAATAAPPGTVPRNLMVEVPSHASVLRGIPRQDDKGQPLPLFEMRGGWVAEPTFADLPVGGLRINVEGIVFLSKGESGVWPAVRRVIGGFAKEELMMHLFGLLGSPFWQPELKRQEEQAEEEWITKTLTHPATVVIPASLITGVRLEPIKGRTYARMSLDDGRIFSVAPADALFDLSRRKHWPDHIMSARFAYESFQFLGRYILAHQPNEVQVVAELSQVLLRGANSSATGRQKVSALQATSGLDHGRMLGEPQYHVQRFRGLDQFKHPRNWTALDHLPPDHIPFCFKCNKLVLRPMAKYCTNCGLWMW